MRDDDHTKQLRQNIEADVATIRKDLVDWVETRAHPVHHGTIMIALLEFAAEHYVALVGEADARDFANKAVTRAAARLSGHTPAIN